ncbi:flagellar basal body rod protein FlgB [Piscinibacter gummiphilus]|uniref:Flagellar basal body rod protein FlgB n=1 Tax=Piscinibacter gummiphilus TaxID=946333 RepID=A0A1W6L4R6_9BURK|nr:hypothetical protein [Piscinibacter gummiphilus]ARN19329.1 hypothetical protein A4W93_05070 [Piscinibacter gummiphilus]ATU63997.1 hypothetical protein CPZ87_05155 [Piscinibacter gummiphilus]GLS93044.1 hypothetical protein GCM10007918_03350 [Piscinibacter gummiphilus]
MSSTPPIHAVDQVAAALSVASLRNQVIAANIANRDVAGYQRMAVAFEQALDAAGATPPGARAVVVPEPGTAGASLEQDMVALSGNALNYQALARALSRYFSIAQTIANGGRN